MKNKLIVFTGPSAVGKATIEKELFKDPKLKLCLSVSATTRNPREGEVEGKHYYFINKEEFNKKIKENEFIEWNEHFSNKYGTLASEIERISNEGKVPFMEVDVMGAKNIINNYPAEQIISIFIAPPSIEALEGRIEERATESSEQIRERLSRVKEELTYKKLFQHVVINDNVEAAVTQVKKILKDNF